MRKFAARICVQKAIWLAYIIHFLFVLKFLCCFFVVFLIENHKNIFFFSFFNILQLSHFYEKLLILFTFCFPVVWPMPILWKWILILFSNILPISENDPELIKDPKHHNAVVWKGTLIKKDIQQCKKLKKTNYRISSYKALPRIIPAF